MFSMYRTESYLAINVHVVVRKVGKILQPKQSKPKSAKKQRFSMVNVK